MAKEIFDMYTLPQEPSSIARLLDNSFRLFSSGFAKVIGIGLMLAASYIAFAFLTALTMGVPPDGSGASPEGFKHNFAAFFAALFGFTLFTFLFYGAIIYRLDNMTHQRQDTLLAALGAGLKKLPNMLFATILYTLALAIGMLLLVVPGVILGLSLSFYWIFIMVDNLGAYASLKASHKLVWGHWWRTL
ncbi:MAG TPA: YciC family protein, partial [Methylococcaceae bacterium]|nr:YciC family protein [Methylococcaceae bacterium]